MNLGGYQTLVFDCDGVILNSNRVKTDAFYKAALPYGAKAAELLVEYHVNNGGISRYKKFEMFLKDMVAAELPDYGLGQLLANYANEVRLGLLSCEVAVGLAALRDKTAHAKWLIVSGGDQAELIEIFALRQLSGYFDAGIFGSPDTKDQILERELDCGNIIAPALFLGDSQYDLEASRRAKLDFAFVSDWSESSYAFEDADFHIKQLNELL